MTTTPVTPTADLDTIHDHPANPRINASADDELVDSIRSQGVLDPLMVAPRPDGGWNLLDGHRRKDAAVRAGLKQVPINPRYDLVTEAQQIEVMVVTGLKKELLTAVEEAAGYEQLELLGMDAGMISAATGLSVRRVKDRMRLSTLPEGTRGRLHAGEMTLLDAESMLEFADDPDATAELEAAIGTDNFRWKVQAVRERRERLARNTATIAEYEDLGAKPFEFPDGANYWSRETSCPLSWFTTDELRDPVAHDGHLGWYGTLDGYGGVMLVCTDASTHPAPARSDSTAQRESEWEQQRAERDKQRALRAAATATRLAWLREHLTGLFAPRTHKDLAAAASAVLPMLVADGREIVDPETLLAGLDALPATTDYQALYTAREAYAGAVASMKPAAALAGLAGWLAAVILDVLDSGAEPSHIDDVDEATRLLTVWDWMKKAGYPLSDFDKDERTALEVRHTELTAEAEAAAP